MSRKFNQPSTFTAIIVANYSKKEADQIVLRELRLAEWAVSYETEQYLRSEDEDSA